MVKQNNDYGVINIGIRKILRCTKYFAIMLIVKKVELVEI